MSRKIEIDEQGDLSKINGGYIQCPLKICKDNDDELCNKDCAWFRIVPHTTGPSNFKLAYCGINEIGEIKKEA